jgi:hypothetical protein
MPYLSRRSRIRVSACQLAVALFHLVLASPVRAGLHYSGESFADLPSQWRGFLLDQRTLRNIALAPAAAQPSSPARTHYLEEATRLEKNVDRLSADELADLGALYVRLGQADKAVSLLRSAQRKHPNHYRVVANLGTAWQLQSDLAQAAIYLEQAVRLAPGKWHRAEQYHLKLVRLRLKEARAQGGLDDLFGVRYLGDKGRYEPGKLAAVERKKLPGHAVAVAQQLALWLPSDGRLLWQLAELANAYGDVRTGAAMMDGCVTQFGMGDAELRRHRQELRAAADRLPAGGLTAKTVHQQEHMGGLTTRSRRPLISRFEQTPLPPIRSEGVNFLPWDLLSQTSVGPKFQPTFHKYMKELDGKEVSLNGFMQPLRQDPDVASFMFIEYPVGCWYCEMPEITSIVYVELPRGGTTPYRRGLVRVVGRLQLNATDPEDFLYAIRQARVTEVD